MVLLCGHHEGNQLPPPPDILPRGCCDYDIFISFVRWKREWGSEYGKDGDGTPAIRVAKFPCDLLLHQEHKDGEGYRGPVSV